MAFADEQVAGLEYDGGSAISVARNAVSKGEDWKYSSVPSLLTPTHPVAEGRHQALALSKWP
jgi:hypothetical protein